MPQQRSLFETEPAPWEEDALATAVLATVVLAEGPDKEFDYLAPDRFLDPRKPEVLLEPGRRVRVPFGRGDKSQVGYCVALGAQPIGGRRLKEVAAVVDAQSLVSPTMLRVTRWMADYYLCPWGQVLEAVVPAGVRGQAGTRDVVLLSLPTRVAARLTTLDVTATQRRVLEALAASPKPLPMKLLMARAGCTAAPINALRKAGLVESRVERLDLGEIEQLVVERESPRVLNADQGAALAEVHTAMDSGEHRTILLHGVTGSGKTEVYVQAIEKVVSFGRQAIVLVPEISLTPQTVGRFRARFDHIAVLHSHQSDVERHRHWKRIASGEVQVVVGARSAVFAPTRRLGLIVVDEEHESTFKQDSAPRYHARDVARRRAEEERVPLVLGSATPALESYHQAQLGAYRLVEMPRRVSDLPMPDVRTVDLRDEQRGAGGRGAISRPLAQAMNETLRDAGQVILLLNRRGFATHLQCPTCGERVECPNCKAALTFHRPDNSLVCHWCDHRQAPPDRCAADGCRNPASLRYGGLGTQRLEAEVRARFPDYPLLRMDTDTMRKPGSHEAALDAFRRGDVRILLGTQMIAKGLDFPNVTLVGVVNADTALSWPDFRAGERTFQLVTQVAGRTGRGPRGGRVLVQTFLPDDPYIQAAVRHDYARFAQAALAERRVVGRPPWGALARVVARGASEPAARGVAEGLVDQVRRHWRGEPAPRFSGPAPAPLEKLRGEYRQHVLVAGPDAGQLTAALRGALAALVVPEGVVCTVDIDPQDMM